jgi:hypothetical protein
VLGGAGADIGAGGRLLAGGGGLLVSNEAGLTSDPLAGGGAVAALEVGGAGGNPVTMGGNGAPSSTFFLAGALVGASGTGTSAGDVSTGVGTGSSLCAIARLPSRNLHAMTMPNSTSIPPSAIQPYLLR